MLDPCDAAWRRAGSVIAIHGVTAVVPFGAHLLIGKALLHVTVVTLQVFLATVPERGLRRHFGVVLQSGTPFRR
ncbi:hypothetical protein VitviT2T_011336 [Vitis vinifera]|uniref:Uncharacterized protein n=1 Tax=Vitis vinifera TaxID=29760 RepID=A0ABY9CC50_VITVI|nr:hypothetical protein VitviT2T_011336 [Vitis vinifera]